MAIIIFNSSTKQNEGGEEEDTSTRGGGTLEKGANTWCAVCVAITFKRAAPLPPRPDIAAKRRQTQLCTHPCSGKNVLVELRK